MNLLVIHVDGVTHYAGERRDVVCGLRLLDHSLAAVMKMLNEGLTREVDCMACIALLGKQGPT